MPDSTALVNALLLGKLDGLAPETIALFARTGLIHLFSASGFHMAVAIVLARAFTYWPERWLRYRWWARVVAVAVQFGLMFLFGWATGWSSPLVRAFSFSALLSTARLLEIRASVPWVFLLSLLFSASLGQSSFLSFLLSALGMAGMLYIQPQRAWAIALGPWLFTLPVVIWAFGLFSASAPLWNLTVGTAVAFVVMPPAVLHLICASAGLPDPFLPVAAGVMSWLVEVLRWGDERLGGAYWVPRIPWLLAVTGLALWYYFGGKYRARALTALALLLWIFHPHPRLAMLDVGQGDSIFFRTAEEKILVDVGPPAFRVGESRASRALGQVGIGAIDHLVLSHFDQDHRGGLDSFLRNHPVREGLWFREDLLSHKAALGVLEPAERVHVPIRFLTEFSSPPGLDCFLAPAHSSNDFSPLCVAKLARGERLWLTGDMSANAERWFVQNYPRLGRADFLKVAHHGSRSSSTEEFLRASGASKALISVGAKNRYGHPTREVLRRLESAKMEVRRSDREGHVIFY